MDISSYKSSQYSVLVRTTHKSDFVQINGVQTNSYILTVTEPLEIIVKGLTHVFVTVDGKDIIPKYSHLVDYHTIGNYVQGDTWRFYCGPSYWEWYWNIQGLGKIF